jgi:integrase
MKRPAAIPFPSPAKSPDKRDKSPVRAGRDHGNYGKSKVRPKARESYRTVPLPVDAVERIKERRAQLPNASFVLEGRKTRPPRKPSREKRSTYEYRAKAWVPLTQWLSEKGVTDLTPLHSLRKMSGSFIYAVAGLEAARLHLGHRDISTTARSYLATRSAVVDFSS